MLHYDICRGSKSPFADTLGPMLQPLSGDTRGTLHMWLNALHAFRFLLVCIVTNVPNFDSMLDVQPELRRVAKCRGEFDRHGGGQGSFVMHDSAERISMNVHGISKFADLDLHGLEKLADQHLSNRYWAAFRISHDFLAFVNLDRSVRPDTSLMLYRSPNEK